MKRAVVTVVMLVSVTAFAGKRERDFMENEIAPAVRAAEAKFKSGCGCALKITVREETYVIGDMRRVKGFAETVGESGSQHCTDDRSRMAMCQMKSLEIRKTGKDEKVAFTFRNGRGLVTTYGNTAPSWDMVTRVLDK